MAAEFMAWFPESERSREEQLRIEEEKIQKYEQGYYASAMEAFYDGTPIDNGDEDYEEEKMPKDKKLRRIKYEALLKSQGKPIPEIPKPRLSTYQSKNFFKDPGGNEYLKFYLKQAKPPMGVQNVYPVEVRTSRVLLLRTADQSSCMKAMTPYLDGLHTDEGYPLPDDVFGPGVACAYHDVVDDHWYRALVGDVSPDPDADVPLLLVDFGRTLIAPRRSLKALRSDKFLKYENQIYYCKLARICEPKPLVAETEIIRDILEKAKEIMCYFERDKEPYRVRLQCSDGVHIRSFYEMFIEKLFSLHMHERQPQKLAHIPKKSTTPTGNNMFTLNSSSALRFTPSVRSVAGYSTDMRSFSVISRTQSESPSKIDDDDDDIPRGRQPSLLSDYERHLEELVEDDDLDVVIIKGSSDEDDSDDDRDERRSIAEMDEDSKNHIKQWIQNYSGSIGGGSTVTSVSDSIRLEMPPNRHFRGPKENCHQAPVAGVPPVDVAHVLKPMVQARSSRSTPNNSVASSSTTTTSFHMDHRRPPGMFCSKIPKRFQYWTDSEQCVVTHVESPMQFYIMLDKNKTRAIVDREKLRRYYARFPIAPLKREELEPGVACVATFSVDNQLYRGEICEVNNDHCEVYFVDFGNRDYCPFDKILPLLKEFNYYPLCVACRLDGFPPTTPLTEELASAFENFVVPWHKLWMIRFGNDYANDEHPLPTVFYDSVSSAYAQSDFMKVLNVEEM